MEWGLWVGALAVGWIAGGYGDWTPGYPRPLGPDNGSRKNADLGIFSFSSSPCPASRIAVACASATPVRNHIAPSRESHGLHIKLVCGPRLGSCAASRVNSPHQNTIGVWSKFRALAPAQLFHRDTACRFCTVCRRLHCLPTPPRTYEGPWACAASCLPQEGNIYSGERVRCPGVAEHERKSISAINKQDTTRTEHLASQASVSPVSPLDQAARDASCLTVPVTGYTVASGRF